MAALLRRSVVRCRSRQLYERLVVPPTNHFVAGASPAITCCGGANQWRAWAISAQKASGSWMLFSYSARYCSMERMWAWVENSSSGAKTRDSFIRLSMDVLMAMVPPAGLREDTPVAGGGQQSIRSACGA
jgi:hypothetical protein